FIKFNCKYTSPMQIVQFKSGIVFLKLADIVLDRQQLLISFFIISAVKHRYYIVQLIFKGQAFESRLFVSCTIFFCCLIAMLVLTGIAVILLQFVIIIDAYMSISYF